MYVEVSAVKHRSIVRLRTYAGLEAPSPRHCALVEVLRMKDQG